MVLKLMVEEMDSFVDVLEASDYPQALNFLSKHHSRIHFVLLDIKLPGVIGLNGLKELRGLYPTLPIIIVSTLDYEICIQQIIAGWS